MLPGRARRRSTRGRASRWTRLRASSACATGAHDARYLTLSPRSLDSSRPGALRFRAPVAHAEPLPDWWNGSRAPLVYVSFGSAAAGNGYYPELYREAAHALGDLDVRVLMTLGIEVDPAALGPVPANVHVERWVPQAQVMPHAAAMIGHGGSGSTLAAMAAGVPLGVLPLFADQERNARRVAEIGAGLHLERVSAAGRPRPARRPALLARRPARPARDRRPRADRRRRTAFARNRFPRRDRRLDCGACAPRSSFWPS